MSGTIASQSLSGNPGARDAGETISPLAGKPAPKEMLVEVARLVDLLAAEITARTGNDPGEHYRELTAEFGTSYYARIDAPATPEQKAKLLKLSPDAVKESDLAGQPISAKLTKAPGNQAPTGGLKVVAASGWFAARPSGTENIYNIYAESFQSQTHLQAIIAEAKTMVSNALGS
jgi:phosphoglucomutase